MVRMFGVHGVRNSIGPNIVPEIREILYNLSVRIHSFPISSSRVGYWQRVAMKNCRSELYPEGDHECPRCRNYPHGISEARPDHVASHGGHRGARRKETMQRVGTITSRWYVLLMFWIDLCCLRREFTCSYFVQELGLARISATRLTNIAGPSSLEIVSSGQLSLGKKVFQPVSNATDCGG